MNKAPLVYFKEGKFCSRRTGLPLRGLAYIGRDRAVALDGRAYAVIDGVVYVRQTKPTLDTKVKT